MTHITPPRRRNGQIRTYWRLLKFAIAQQLVTNESKAKTLYNEFQAAKARIDANTQEPLLDVNVEELVTAAQSLLGFPGGDAR